MYFCQPIDKWYLTMSPIGVTSEIIFQNQTDSEIFISFFSTTYAERWLRQVLRVAYDGMIRVGRMHHLTFFQS